MYEKLKHFLPQCDEERNKINKESRHKKELQSSFAVLSTRTAQGDPRLELDSQLGAELGWFSNDK